MGKLVDLDILTLRDNKITEIPPTFGQLTKLTLLLLQGNKLQWLPPSLSQCTALKIDPYRSGLKLAGNPLAKPIVAELQKGPAAFWAYLESPEYQSVIPKAT
jgi:hypothetical protein